MYTPTVITSMRDTLVKGNYHFVHDFITEKNFPLMQHNQILLDTLRVIFIDREMPTDWVCNLIRKQGLYPANIYYLLHFGAMNPEMAVTTPIIALGTIVDYVEDPFPPSKKKPHCVGIHDMSGRRGINLVPSLGLWGKGCGFLAYSV